MFLNRAVKRALIRDVKQLHKRNISTQRSQYRPLGHDRYPLSQSPPPAWRQTTQGSPFLRQTTRTYFGALPAKPSIRQRYIQLLKQAQKDHPVQLPILVILSFISVASLGFFAYDDYFNKSPKFGIFPPPVEEYLRLGIYYTEIEEQPQKAIENFTAAIQKGAELQMDKWSDEVLGMRIRLAAAMEKFGLMKESIRVLDVLVQECKKKVDELDGKGSTTSKVPASNDLAQDRETMLGRGDLRKKLVRKQIECLAKIGELQGSDWIQQDATAAKTLSDAIGILFRESNNPQINGFTEDNGAGMSYEEIAILLDQLATAHARLGGAEGLGTATQLSMLALQPTREAYNNQPSCQEAAVLSRIGANMLAAVEQPGAIVNGKLLDDEGRSKARRSAGTWLRQATAMVGRIPEKERDERCAISAATATINMAVVLQDMGQKEEAKETLEKILPRVRKLDIQPLIERTEYHLRELSGDIVPPLKNRVLLTGR